MDHISSGKKLCLATIIRRHGSAPRGLGAKCLVDEHGILWGSVGGGPLEAEVIRRAKLVLEKSTPEVLKFRLDNTDIAQYGMICGGNVDILLEPVLPSHLDFWKALQRCLKAKFKGIQIITLLDQTHWKGPSPPKWILSDTEVLVGDPLAGKGIYHFILQNASTGPLAPLMVLSHTELHEVLVEQPSLPFRVVIFGGGHLGQYVAAISKMLEFEVVVVDDQEEFLRPALFPPGTKLIHSPFRPLKIGPEMDEHTFLVIVTRGHQSDLDVLRQVIRSSAPYIGMVGSKRKRQMIFDTLKQEGVTENELARVHTPIGLPIGAETPQEIAVSIMAEIIKKKAELFGR
jgi:xanthine dehydrogenase accessory factor